jgi:hypothetical protein
MPYDPYSVVHLDPRVLANTRALISDIGAEAEKEKGRCLGLGLCEFELPNSLKTT